MSDLPEPGFSTELSTNAVDMPRLPRIQSSGARSYACGFLSSFREPVVLMAHLAEVLFERRRCRFGSQRSDARRVLAVVRCR